MGTVLSDYDSIADELLQAHYPQLFPNEIPYILEKYASRSIDGESGFFYSEIQRVLSEKLLSKRYWDIYTQKQTDTFKVIADFDGSIIFIAANKEELKKKGALIIIQNNNPKFPKQIVKFEDYIGENQERYANRDFSPKMKAGELIKKGDTIGIVSIELYTHRAHLYRSIEKAVFEHGKKKVDWK